MRELLTKIIENPPLHAKWLNTLSFLENCGARMIAKCEHKTLVREEMLKHAAEEFRHAHHLKKQIGKITDHIPPTYALIDMLGGTSTLHYLPKLDLHISQITQDKSLSYLLVTYAIEKRALLLYPLYDTLLKENRSTVSVRSILLEEEEHLADMKRELSKQKNGLTLALEACRFEQNLFDKLVNILRDSIKKTLAAE